VGVVLMPTDPWAETVACARRLEALGYDHLWVYDHLSWQRYRDRPWHATYPWLAALAAQTTTIRLGTMVANPNLRHPMLLAKDAMTIDHVSAGRFTLGVGAGGTGFDATVLGAAPLAPRERADRLDEMARVLDGLLRGDLTDHRGRWYTIEGARMLPGCVQRPRVPIAIAASGPRTLRLTAELADAWITLGDASGDDRSEQAAERAVRAQLDALDAACRARGRDPSGLDRIFLAGHTDADPLRSLGAFTEFAGRCAQLGFTDLVFHHPRADDPIWASGRELVDAIPGAVRDL
jgi:alkanesulfonate monooxygenase SsuD/methylene tetrahydromethanopterin reductase-like flavin-dependent oxidoreductase (luciferase family)